MTDKANYLPQLAAGKIGTLALFEPHADWDLQHIDVAAKCNGDWMILSGTKQFVMRGCTGAPRYSMLHNMAMLHGGGQKLQI